MRHSAMEFGDEADVMRQAGYAIGVTLITINKAEQALDHVIFTYFKLEPASLTMLPFMDFRSKVTLVRDDALLTEIVGTDTVKRLHSLYDRRNVIAHGYFEATPPGDRHRPGDNSDYVIKHARRGQSLSASEVLRTNSDALQLVDRLLAAREEIEHFLQPLAELRQEFPDLSPKDFVAHLRELAEAADADD